jgi:beta-1,4-N-acetylglucosaminyltransferase
MVVLGSGGHTAEMLNILSQIRLLQFQYTHRTYIISSGDNFSALKAHEFESNLRKNSEISKLPVAETPYLTYDVVTVHRARKVHQSLLTTPVSSLRCLWECIAVLRGAHHDFNPGHPRKNRTYPDIILTNGPGTGVMVILASILLLFFGLNGPASSSTSNSSPSTATNNATSDTSLPTYPQGQMRSIYIESWARVKKLSLSGRILKPFVDRFLVQWPQLREREGERVEYIGPLVT